MGIIEYAKNELSQLLDGENEKLQGEINEDIIEVLELLKSQGHTIMSVSYLIKIVERLMYYKPLTPLSGREEEWDEEGRNKRCPSVVKEGDKYYDTDVYIFINPKGEMFKSRESKKEIEFPYVPRTHKVYLKYSEEEKSIREQLDESLCTII